MAKTIFLLGFMASGKSSLGKKLARKMAYAFYDLDSFIEMKEASSISQIFAEQGEDAFRKLEKKYLNELILVEKDKVISLGGGTPCYEDNMQSILDSGTSIYLKVEKEILLGRLKQNRSKRPLIASLSDAELAEWLQEKLKEREQFYNQAEIILESNNPGVDDILKRLA